MSKSGDLLDDGAEWVELSPYTLNTGRNSPRSHYAGVVMHSTDLSMLCSALEDHIKTSIAPLNATVGTTASENQKNMDFTSELCVGQFGEWPSRPNVSGPCSLPLSTGPNSSEPYSTDLTPPNSLEESYISKPECAQNVYPPEEAGQTLAPRSHPTGIRGGVFSMSSYLVLITQWLIDNPVLQNFHGSCLRSKHAHTYDDLLTHFLVCCQVIVNSPLRFASLRCLEKNSNYYMRLRQRSFQSTHHALTPKTPPRKRSQIFILQITASDPAYCNPA
ncbi:hypothetical protein TcWFU_001221 [Taenia crassiceps]|uniref:Uncharacterized protein n=1 Tax=Taenia crassiceps TaxID=6207 RepID=A0ABR4QP41_9CEST